ncbi:hypothetical protein FSARC_702 [Fusarium sarcochroum]|uniref:Uncharacterized protein n=1 Tax=Fusarium sarcochroum TaxID=1208366 RepID=A0A8H4UAI5_9HYPO|nr:hypothetical protein FSARC_702 [Fusarium sarcochroum]
MDDTSQYSTFPTKDHSIDTAEVFDEDKCRNVLVRYCAHIPRNYQYRDGIRLVFLVLRDHLGDEFLGLAGGVLYEMIEVDCQHSDDPGAAFQRWRYDHLNRHADLELPHIPHLTTVTSNIIPTTALIQWRKIHPQRYRTRLSDYSPVTARSSLYPSGIGTRKNWVIDYTIHGKINQMMHKIRSEKDTGPHDTQWPTAEHDHHSTVLVHEMLEQRLTSHVRDCEIPNANFARKFGLYTDGRPLPPFIRELPVAEDKAMDMATGYPPRDLVYSWRFQGPFTPQLWFDSGIDYRWKQSSC